MSIAIMVIGESGTGKSASLRNMNPAETLLIQAIKKPLPFRSSEWSYLTKDNPSGNMVVCDQSTAIIDGMRRTKRAVIVLDDFQYVLANEFMRRSDERGYDKFTDIGRHAWDILTTASSLPDHVRVYILSHSEQTDSGRTKAKTIGKMLDDKITLEGMFSIVLRTSVINEQYIFKTKNNGNDTTKTPIGLFDEEMIPNDLSAVDSKINEYYKLTITE